MKKLLIPMIGISALALSGLAVAGGPQTDVAKDASGIYINANAGYGWVSDLPNVAGVLDDEGFAWSANVGYQFNPYVAVELGYRNLPNIKFLGETVVKNIYGLDAAVKGIYPASERFDVFAKAGVAWMSGKAVGASKADTQFTPLLGAGFDVNLTDNLALTAEVSYTFEMNDFPETIMTTAGLTYKFAL